MSSYLRASGFFPGLRLRSQDTTSSTTSDSESSASDCDGHGRWRQSEARPGAASGQPPSLGLSEP